MVIFRFVITLKKIGISHTHLDSIEKGYDPRTGKPVTISLDTFVKLSDATGIPLEELLFMLKYNLNDLEAIEEKPATSRTPIESMLLRYFQMTLRNLENICKLKSKSK